MNPAHNASRSAVPERVSSFVAGEPVPLRAGGHDLPVICPATEETLSLLREADAAETGRAVAVARAAFDSGPWPRLDINERKDVLYAIRDHLRAHAEELALLEVWNTGIPLSHVRGQVAAREQGVRGFVPVLARQRRIFTHADVGRIAHDQVELPRGRRREQIRPAEAHARPYAQAPCVVAGQGERSRR